MKERDITELLVGLPGFQAGEIFRPFVILSIPRADGTSVNSADSFAGYLVWLAFCHTRNEAHKLAVMPRESKNIEQTIEYWMALPCQRFTAGDRHVVLYEAVPDAPTSPESELMIGRVSDGLYLWGVHNTR